jgi:TetR/AcrR family transcriptional regulator, transcriptional repressor for nem operon
MPGRGSSRKTETTVPQAAEAEPGPASQPSPREQAKAETREALIMAALEEFGAHGLEAPSLDAICARAGYTRGAFYVHFKDRDELIAAVMERVLGRFMDAMIATGDAALDLERTVRTFAEAVAHRFTPLNESVRTYQLYQACARSEFVRLRHVELVSEAQRRVGSAVAEGQQAGTVRADVEADQVGLLLVGLVLATDILQELKVPFDVKILSEAVLRLLAPIPTRPPPP